MSDYTAPDKVDGSSTWSAAEHNQMKAAINSKFDKVKIKNDLSPASADTVPSTQLLSEIVGNAMLFRDEINGSSNLNTFIASGFYTCTAPGGGTWHISFPSEMPEELCKIGLLVYSQPNYINQELTLYLDKPRVFKRICNGDTSGEGWSNWVEYTTVERAREDYAPAIRDGVPTVALEDVAGYTISKTPETRDTGGKITITNNGGNILPFVTFKVSFGIARPDIVSVSLTPANDLATAQSWQLIDVSPGVFKAKTAAQLNVGQSASFYFSTILNS